jgi:hypothetical protein
MASITTRSTAGSGATVKNLPLSNSEIDTNFINLNTNKVEITDAVSANTANLVVRRDASGGFLSGSIGITGTLSASGATTLTSTLAVTGNTTLTADLAVNGGDITTNATIFNLINTNATEINFGSAATSISIGSNSAGGTGCTIPSPLLNAPNAVTSVKSLGVGSSLTAPTTSGEIRAAGNISSNYSDERLKENIQVIENALEKVCSLRGVTYTANQLAESFGYTSKESQVGVLAGEVEKVLPEVVKPAPFDIMVFEGVEISRSNENYKTVQYEKLVPLLIEAIKELNKEIQELKGVK